MYVYIIQFGIHIKIDISNVPNATNFNNVIMCNDVGNVISSSEQPSCQSSVCETTLRHIADMTHRVKRRSSDLVLLVMRGLLMEVCCPCIRKLVIYTVKIFTIIYYINTIILLTIQYDCYYLMMSKLKSMWKYGSSILLCWFRKYKTHCSFTSTHLHCILFLCQNNYN